MSSVHLTTTSHTSQTKPSAPTVLHPSKPGTKKETKVEKTEPCSAKGATDDSTTTTTTPSYTLTTDDVGLLDTVNVPKPTEISLDCISSENDYNELAQVVYERVPPSLADIILNETNFDTLISLIKIGSSTKTLSIVRASELLVGLVIGVQNVPELRIVPLAQMALVMEIFKCVTVFAFKGTKNVPSELAQNIAYVYPAITLTLLNLYKPGNKALMMDPLGALQSSIKQLKATKYKGKRAKKSSDQKVKPRGRKPVRYTEKSGKKRKDDDSDDDKESEDENDEEDQEEEEQQPPKRSSSKRRKKFKELQKGRKKGKKPGCFSCWRKSNRNDDD